MAKKGASAGTPGEQYAGESGGKQEQLPADTSRALAARHGEDWVRRIRDAVNDAARALEVAPLHYLPGGRSAAVALVEKEGTNYVLKLSADIKRTECEVAALTHYHHYNAAPRVLDQAHGRAGDTPWHAYLMEHVGRHGDLRSPAAARHARTHLPGIAAELLYALKEAGAAPQAQTRVPSDPVGTRLRRGLDRGTGGGLHGSEAPSPWQAQHARTLLESLEASTTASLLHGALHPGNLLLTPDTRLLVIDPLPQTGDFAYDAAEVALKLGSESRGRPHNLSDGVHFLAALPDDLVDKDKAHDYMIVLAHSGV